mgnify:CR=1 FL=1
MTSEHRIFSTAELRAEGMTRARIGTAVRLGYLIRARRGFYVGATTPDVIVRAVRVGGRLTCLSLLALMGVFVLRNDRIHVHLPRTASRMRSPHSRRVRLESQRVRGVRLHWLPLIDPVPREYSCVAVIDALAHAVLCQTPRAAIATLDSALHLGHISEAGLADVFRALPAKYGVLRALIDGRAESGPETLMRLMLRVLGCDTELQVEFDGIGRVGLVVDGWLVIECDSKEFHESWEQQVKDRDRDLALAARGYVVLRLTATQIMYRDQEVLAAVRGLLAGR